MRLARLLRRISSKGSGRFFDRHSQNVDITALACDSRVITPGCLFVAIDGTKAKGSDFIDEAIRKGAAGVVTACGRAKAHEARVPVIWFPDTRYALAVLADEFFGHPCGKLKVIGVTGTNGKTTVTYLIRSILEKAHFSCGIIGTINHSFKDKIIPAGNTTPGPLELQALLKQMCRAGCDYCIMEVSSHSLDQKRTAGIDFKAAIFTNLTHDHLDYHLNLENYFSAKRKLFEELNEHAFSIINADDPYAAGLKSLKRGKLITYGIDSADADIRATNLRMNLAGSGFILNTKKRKTKIKTGLIGRHNVSNILAAAAFALSQKIDLSRIAGAVESFKGVRGRLERIEAKERNVFVDYAHTPDAFFNVLGTLRNLARHNLILVFGCGGERDSLKRPLMGKLAQEYADKIIITSDNPRSEDPQKIADDIISGMKADNYKLILDRKEAIEYGLSVSKPGDTVLIAGKGHEHYQIFKDKRIEFDDAACAGQFLQQICLA